MESNGIPGKIHVSESTAELLRHAGKENWLVLRDEQIMAKGKGMMQTYWCELRPSSTPSINRSSSSGTNAANGTTTSTTTASHMYDEEASQSTIGNNYCEVGDHCILQQSQSRQ